MAIVVVFISRIVTVDGASTPANGQINWQTDDTVVESGGGEVAARDGSGAPMRDVAIADPAKGFIREFAVSSVAGDRTVAYFDPGIYLVRVTSPGELVRLRFTASTFRFYDALTAGGGLNKGVGAGKDFFTDANLADTNPAGTLGLTTKDAVAVYAQPVNQRHMIVRETEGPRRIRVRDFLKVGILASASATNVEVEILG
jgi:hypothetical protein